MIRGIAGDRVPGFRNIEYDDPHQATGFIKEILNDIGSS